MTDREKLIELVRGAFHKCLSVVCRDCEEYDPDAKASDRICQYRLFADHLLANGVTFATDNNDGGKWTPVTERLPKSGEIVLCNTTYFVEVLQWDERADAWCGQHRGYHKSYVTHWMPLPEPPKEGE